MGDGWRWSNSSAKIQSGLFEKISLIPDGVLLQAVDILNEAFAYKFIELLWLELASLGVISFRFQPDTLTADLFIGLSEEAWDAHTIDDFEGVGQMYTPTLDDKPWLRIEYSIDQSAMREMREDGELDDYLAEIDDGSWIAKDSLIGKELIRFIESDIDSEVQDEIMRIFIADNLYHALPGFGCVDIKLSPVERELSARLNGFAWRWATLNESQQRAIIGAIIETETDEGAYMGYLVSIHPDTQGHLKAWLSLERSTLRQFGSVSG